MDTANTSILVMSRQRLSDATKATFIGDRRRPDSAISQSTGFSLHSNRDNRANDRFHEEVTPEWMGDSAPTSLPSSNAAASDHKKGTLEKFAVSADGMDDIAKFRAKMKARERVSRDEALSNGSPKLIDSASTLATEIVRKDTRAGNESMPPTVSEADHKAEEVALGRGDALFPFSETGAEALLSKRLMSAAGVGGIHSNSAGSTAIRGGPRFGRLFELEGEPPSISPDGESSAPPPETKRPDLSLSNPIAVLSQRFPDAVISKASDPYSSSVVLSEADLLAQVGRGTLPGKPQMQSTSASTSNKPLPQSIPLTDDFSRIMQMLSKPAETVSPTSPFVGLPPDRNGPLPQPNNTLPFQSMSHVDSNHNIYSNTAPYTALPILTAQQQQQRQSSYINQPNPTTLASSPPIYNNVRPNVPHHHHLGGNVVSNQGRPGGVYAQHISQAGTGIAAMVQAGILAKKSSSSSAAAALGIRPNTGLFCESASSSLFS